MKKKLLAMLVAGVLGATLLAGCGGEEPAATETTETEEASDEASDESSSEITFADLQDNYAVLVDCYNQVEDLYMSDQIAQDDDIESLLSEAKGIIDEMGEATEDDFSSQEDYQTMNDSMVSLIDSLGKIVDGMETTGSDSSDESSEEGAGKDALLRRIFPLVVVPRLTEPGFVPTVVGGKDGVFVLLFQLRTHLVEQRVLHGGTLSLVILRSTQRII